MNAEADQRLQEISLVMKEKETMVKVAQELLVLLDVPADSKNMDELTIGKKILEFISHLSIIGGFCDTNTRRAIFGVITALTASAIDPNPIFTPTGLKMVTAMAIGIQVDFTKRPFKAVGVDVKALGARLKAYTKR